MAKITVESGPSPFGDFDAFKEFKRATKKQQKDNWSLSGWKKPSMRKLTSSSGNLYELPEDDYQDYMKFFRSSVDEQQSEEYKQSGNLKSVKTPADYVDYAFSKENKDIYEQQGVGHIIYLWYTAKYQILKIQFKNGTICCFFRVPATIAATLIAMAQSGTTRVTDRGEHHLLGIYFWDLIRIRGTVHGTRYKFIYTDDKNTGGLSGRPYGSGKYFYEDVRNVSPKLQKYIDENGNVDTSLSDDTKKILQDFYDKYNVSGVIKKNSYIFDDKYNNLTAFIQHVIDNGISQEDIAGKTKLRRRQYFRTDAEKEAAVARAEQAINDRLESKEAKNLISRAKEVYDKLYGDFGELNIKKELYYDDIKYNRDGPKLRREARDLENQFKSLYAKEHKAFIKTVNTPVTKRDDKDISRAIKGHNVDRRWKPERFNAFVDELQAQGKLKNDKSFNSMFPTDADKFRYLQSRGFIKSSDILVE